MYRWTRTADVQAGKLAEGVGWAVQTTRWVNEKFPDLKVGCFMETFGAVQRVHWTCDFESLDDFAAKTEKLLADKEYMQRLAQTATIYVSRAGHDTLVKKLG